MEFNVISGNPQEQSAACLIIGVFQPRTLSESGKILDKASKGFLSRIINGGDMEGRAGQTLLLHQVPGVTAERILLIGCGKQKEMNETAFVKMIGNLSTALDNSGASDACACLGDIPVEGRDVAWHLRQAVLKINHCRYQFDQLKSSKQDRPDNLKKLSMLVADKSDLVAGETAIAQGIAISAGMDIARDLGNLPANICTPSYIAKKAKQLSRGHKKLKVTVLEEDDMHELKMGSFLSVSAGSREPAKLITMEYQGADRTDQPVVLVGKGVTFDTGGISLKPGAGMDEMKFDMCGAASVIGTMNAVVALDLPINVVGIIPATENMPGGFATKPGDIVTSMSGQTIEILNTDAEGRLILCDALTFAAKFKPRCVIDIATLTGACLVALGKVPSAVLGNDRALIDELIQSGKQIEDKLWELPLWEEYQDQLKSNFADMANIGGRDAGTITAACFLSRFTKQYQWAHLDIAGTAWNSGEAKGSTGRPVPLLTQFIINQIQ